MRSSHAKSYLPFSFSHFAQPACRRIVLMPRGPMNRLYFSKSAKSRSSVSQPSVQLESPSCAASFGVSVPSRRSGTARGVFTRSGPRSIWSPETFSRAAFATGSASSVHGNGFRGSSDASAATARTTPIIFSLFLSTAVVYHFTTPARPAKLQRLKFILQQDA